MEVANISSSETRSAILQTAMRDAIDKQLVESYHGVLLDIVSTLDDIEIDDYVLTQFSDGLFTSKIDKLYESSTGIDPNPNSVIAICAVHDSENLIVPYIEHYAGIGVQNFVFIDNDSSDTTIQKIVNKSQNTEDLAIEVWSTPERFDGFKAMGWKQRMFHHYGLDRWYLNLDVDEHFVYEECESKNVGELTSEVRSLGARAVRAMLLDMYPNLDITDGDILSNGFTLQDLRNCYAYFDKDTYEGTPSEKYSTRIFGGPRTRVFNRHPSLQKYPLMYVEQDTLAINPHFWYPYSANDASSEVSAALLHYKFLPGDIEKYRRYVASGVHWDNSSQYKSYVDGIDKLGGINFFDANASVKYLGSVSLQEIEIHQTEELTRP